MRWLRHLTLAILLGLGCYEIYQGVAGSRLQVRSIQKELARDLGSGKWTSQQEDAFHHHLGRLKDLWNIVILFGIVTVICAGTLYFIRDPTQSARANPLQRTLLLVACNLGILLLGLVLLELIFGSWFRPNRMNRLYLPRNLTKTYDVHGLYPGAPTKAIYKRDQYGLRGAYSSPADIDILTLGGSTTDQRLITEGQTWQDVLAREFKNAGKSVAVVNAGVDGQSSYGHIKAFDWWFPVIPNLRVKYYLCYLGINDFFKRPEDRDQLDDLLNYVGDRPPSRRAWIKENSAIYHLIETAKGLYEASRVVKVAHRRVDFAKVQWTDTPRIANSGHAALMEVRLRAYRRRLEVLAAKAGQAGGKPVFVAASCRLYKRVDDHILGTTELIRYGDVDVNGVDYYHMMHLLNQVTLDVCAKNGGIPVNLADEIQWEDSDFYDYYHNNPQGAEKLGRYLYSKLNDLF